MLSVSHKAGADFINISGFDGGTGAARIHALQHVESPCRNCVKAAHNALLEASTRHKVEIWADGGIRSVNDALENHASSGQTVLDFEYTINDCNRLYYLPWVSHLDTCHVW